MRPKRINLGLDLQGGASIMLEGDTEKYKSFTINQKLSNLWIAIEKDGLDISKNTLENGSVVISFKADDKDLLSNRLKELDSIFDYSFNLNTVLITIDKSKVARLVENVVKRSVEIVRHRVDSKGTKEIEVQQKGGSGIIIQVPGAKDPSEVKNLVGKTAKLSFHKVVRIANVDDVEVGFDESSLVLDWDKSKKVIFKKRPLMSGEELDNAFVSVNELGIPVVNFELNKLGTKRFAEISSKNIGNAIAIVLDNKVLNIPVIREQITGGSGSISGNFDMKKANELALLLKAGALPMQLNVVEERTVGPGLGTYSIEHGVLSAKVSCAIIALIMVLFYRFLGFIAIVGLFFNLTLLISVFSILGITLTLPGIAGIVLTTGMAVDANVLIYERIKEELRRGASYIMAIESGYKSAIVTITDSNVTTIISSIILYIFSYGPVRGFSICLIVGIICSMITAVFLTKLFIEFLYPYLQKKRAC